MVALESSKLFNRLGPEELKRLKEVAQERHYAADQEIFKEGAAGDGVYVVKAGVVQVTVQAGESGRRVFSQVGPGEMFGEMAVIENKPRSANVVAVADTDVYFIPRDAMLGMLESSPQLSFMLVREISSRLREFNHHYISEVLQAERLALVGRFARSIVHDLKNPLNIIGLAAEMVGRENASAASRHMGQEWIRQQVERISDLINEILEYTQGTPSELVLTAVDYSDYIAELVEEMGREIQLKSAVIELDNLPPNVRLLVNPKRLQRVFHNLIHNATDAMPQGGRIKLRFHTNGREVTTEIEDTGPGIPQEVLDSLFDAFVTHGKAHGTGLGLSICKRIIEDHKGRISARNQPNGGAVLAFTLPLAQG